MQWHAGSSSPLRRRAGAAAAPPWRQRGGGSCPRCCCPSPAPGLRAAPIRRTAAGWRARCRRSSDARWSGLMPPSPTHSSCSGSLSPGRSSSAESRTIRHSVPSAPGRSCWRLLGRAWCGSAPPTPTRTAKEYVEQLLKPQDPARLGSDTLYFFGDNNFTEWGHLFQQYVPPPFRIPGTSPAYSFGIAGSGSGVPFHWHGPGYSEVIFGRKRWFLYPPDQAPHFHPNETTLAWLHHTYPTLPPAQRPLECTLRPGEVLYFPDRWWHATLNLDTSVFISTFLG
ncbi:jmjC domain-containing protein 8 isoform X2 [Pogoniulus pusillus]|uniref:jmjC domain-containing protein 8 isoform X2 n=1 Tax=Pogoniulus pusillus TaxID=488313 RepID=UPI0030B95E61